MNTSTTLRSLGQTRAFWFVRHGATQPNLDGLRCGGDLDVELTDIGRAQIRTAARELQREGAAIDWIVCSDLKRTDESARLLSAALGGREVLVMPAFRERHLGCWNLTPAADTEEELRRGVTPPGGEAVAAFSLRIEMALHALARAACGRRTLLVGSRGVARVMRELDMERARTPSTTAGLIRPPDTVASNGEILHFHFNRHMPSAACLEGAST